MDFRTSLLVFFTCLYTVDDIFAQQQQPIVKLQNPSFEGPPRTGTEGMIPNWINCPSSSSESAPDTQPGQFSVTKTAQHGQTYLGMVVRDNDTREGVGQRLSSTLKVDYCYSFSVWLCRSDTYLSDSRTSGTKVNYVVPLKLKIYGGNNYCDKYELLAETGEITTFSWLEYKFEFKPKKDCNYIFFEAAHKTPTLVPYNGNVLVDNASVLVPKYCGNPSIASAKNKRTPEKIKKIPNKDNSTVASVNTQPTNLPRSYENNSNTQVYDRKRMKVGQTIGIEKLSFDADSSNIKTGSYMVLNELYQFMISNQDLVIEVGGHTNDIPPDDFCDRLSSARAKAVVDYLVTKGIQNERVKYKGYGKRQPLFPNINTENRRRNQRVEIKILSMG